MKSKKRAPNKAVKSVPGSDNIFQDLGFPNADELALKSDLVRHITREIDRRGLTQKEAAELLGVNQPKVSALKNGKLTDFAIERLMRFLVALGQTVDITVRPATAAAVRVLKAS